MTMSPAVRLPIPGMDVSSSMLASFGSSGWDAQTKNGPQRPIAFRMPEHDRYVPEQIYSTTQPFPVEIVSRPLSRATGRSGREDRTLNGTLIERYIERTNRIWQSGR